MIAAAPIAKRQVLLQVPKALFITADTASKSSHCGQFITTEQLTEWQVRICLRGAAVKLTTFSFRSHLTSIQQPPSALLPACNLSRSSFFARVWKVPHPSPTQVVHSMASLDVTHLQLSDSSQMGDSWLALCHGSCYRPSFFICYVSVQLELTASGLLTLTYWDSRQVGVHSWWLLVCIECDIGTEILPNR